MSYQTMNTYLVYGKKKTDKRFKPFDMRDNKFVVNLFYASMFFDDDLEKLTQEIKFMNEKNPDYVFEIRRHGKKNVI